MHLPILFLAAAIILMNPTASAADESFIYAGCSQTKYSPSTQYETNLNSLLTTILNAATYSSFNNFTAGNSLHGLFQCRLDLPAASCAACVSHSVTQLGVICGDSVGASLQLDGCLVRYDNASFFGVEDKSLAARKCGSVQLDTDSDELTRRDSVLSYLAAGNELFRVGGSGDVRGVAECVGDLSAGQCRDCLAEAIGRLKTDCGSANWGDVFLAKCYSRYSIGARNVAKNESTKDDETEKTLAIIIGLIAVVALITLFAAFLRKICEEDKDGKS